MKEMGVCFLVPLSSYLSPLHAVSTIWRTGTRIAHSLTFLSEEITKMGNECRKKHQSRLLEIWDWTRDQKTKLDLNFKILGFV